MGVIKDGKVSGFIPSKEAFVVHYPGYPSSTSRAIQTLGGTEAIIKARGLQSNKLELFFRPEDPYSHPASGERRSCNNLLLKISKKKSSLALSATGSVNNPKTESQDETERCVDVAARIPEAYHFEGMVDYQHVVAVHADVARRKKRNWTEMEEPQFEKAGLMDLDHGDVMILMPPLFSPKDMPEHVALRPPAISSSKKKQEERLESYVEMNIEPALAIDFNVREIPKKINWEEYIKQGTRLWVEQMAVSELFEEQPIWPKESLTERLLDKDMKFSHPMLKRLLLAVAYYFSSGPFLRFWIKKGYDPRKDPESRIYQRIDFRVPPLLRGYCDDNAANGIKHKWEDLCKFQVFPYKCQTSFQLYELDDDYIQQEIRKPSKQNTCAYGTGWFSQHVHDSLRLRVIVRFLSVYPKTGAEKLLKAASEDFEKSKRACIYMDTLKPDQEEHRQINKEVTGEEANENRNNVDDGEVDEIESDDHEEVLDAYEAFDLDLADEDGELSLQSHSYLDMENNSRSYLQGLFDSFPSTVGGADADGSDGEYKIYEQEGESYLDDDDD